MLWEVQTLNLLLLGYSKAHCHVEELEQDEACTEAPGDGYQYANYLRKYLTNIANYQPFNTIVA